MRRALHPVDASHAAAFAILALVFALLWTDRASAAGPLFVNDAGAPLVWVTRPVPWSSDAGGLGVLDHAAAVQLVDESFGVWAAVPTASISFADAGTLPVDVTAANIGQFFGVCDDDLSPVVFDTDGSITDALFGAGASNSILGFAGPECGTFDPPVITEASAVLNGKFLDGIATSGNPEVDPATFSGVLVHEFGHYVNLDHSQINLLEAFDGNDANDDTVATMFPFLVSGPEAATLAKDDEVSLAMLYPSATFAATTAAITGEIRRGDTDAPFTGAFVIARNVADPRHDAVGFASGARFTPGGASALAGAYELAGLTPGADYTVEVEAISPLFTSGSSVGPLSPPVPLPGPPEFWSGAAEAGTNPPDDPDADGTPITVAAGAVTTGIDVVLNVTPPPPNDACADATTVTTFPFATTIDTTLATTATTDPVPSCVVSTRKPSKSVWFRLTSAVDGTLTIATSGSTFDTVVAAFTGTCSALAPVGCNDDTAATDPTATLVLPVTAGTPYLVEVTDFATTGGTLVFSVTFDGHPPASCRAGAPGQCTPGNGGPRTDCVTEWLVEPTPPLASLRTGARNVPTTRIECPDGDPRCDFDGVTEKNGSCLFHVAVCANNADPRLAARNCVPSAITEYRVLAPSPRRPRDAADAANAATLLQAVADLALPATPTIANGRVTFASPLSAPDRCTTFQDVVIPVGTRFLRTRALTTTKRSDGDQLRLRCVR